MLCGISVVFNSLGDVSALVSRQRGSENRQVLILKLGDPDSGARATTETPSQKRPAAQWDMGDLL
jgi:hypothetical protein